MLSRDDEDETEEDREAGRFSAILKERLRAVEGLPVPLLRGRCVDSNCDAIVLLLRKLND
jgi:hypothetical protein